MIHDSPCICDLCLSAAAAHFRVKASYHYSDEACECKPGAGPCDSCREAIEDEIRAEEAAQQAFSEFWMDREEAAEREQAADMAELTDLGRWSAEG